MKLKTCLKKYKLKNTQDFNTFLGANRYYDNLKMMLGYEIGSWLKICWCAVTPIVIFVSIDYLVKSKKNIYCYVEFGLITYV